MKTIGLIGGLSWHSSAIYYKHLNQLANSKLGDLSSARIHMVNLDFQQISKLMLENNWNEINKIMQPYVIQLQNVGCSAILIANNTLHQLIPFLESNITIPILHIADALGEKLHSLGIERIGLLGTRSTMQSTFYKDRLNQKYSVQTLIPSDRESNWLNSFIFNELCRGKVTSCDEYKGEQLIENLVNNGAQAIALACTELPLLFQQASYRNVQFLDTGFLHCNYAIEWSLNIKKGSTDE